MLLQYNVGEFRAMKELTEIQAELERVREVLAGAPRLEMTALYAAQQTLAWALGEAVVAPLDAIQGKQPGSGDCSARSRLPSS